MWVSFHGRRDYRVQPVAIFYLAVVQHIPTQRICCFSAGHCKALIPVMKRVSAHKVWCIVARVQHHVTSCPVQMVHVLIVSLSHYLMCADVTHAVT